MGCSTIASGYDDRKVSPCGPNNSTASAALLAIHDKIAAASQPDALQTRNTFEA